MKQSYDVKENKKTRHALIPSGFVKVSSAFLSTHRDHWKILLAAKFRDDIREKQG